MMTVLRPITSMVVIHYGDGVWRSRDAGPKHDDEPPDRNSSLSWRAVAADDVGSGDGGLPDRYSTSLTVSEPPPISNPFGAEIAAIASSDENISTKPKPSGFPVNQSMITLVDST